MEDDQVDSPELELPTAMDTEGAKIKTPPTQAPRSRLLLSCGRSVLAVAQKACHRIETMSCLARGVSHMSAPILSPLQQRCLSALSFLDKQLAVVQDVAAVLFPRSEGVFRKVDELVLLVESLPVRFDGAIDGIEVLVACVKSGVTGLAPKRCCCRDDDVFRDIRCDDEEEGALHRATADDEVVVAVEKRCEDATREVESVEVVVTVDGSDHDDDDGGAGDPAETTGTAGPAETITEEETEHDEKAEGDVQDACEEATQPETDQPEVSYEVAERTCEADSKGEEDLVKRNVSSGGEECVQELEQQGRPMEVAEGAETHTAEIIEAMQRQEIVSVESQEVSSQDGGASEIMGEAIAISGSGKDSREDALLDLFDEAWQQKLA